MKIRRIQQKKTCQWCEFFNRDGIGHTKRTCPDFKKRTQEYKAMKQEQEDKWNSFLQKACNDHCGDHPNHCVGDISYCPGLQKLPCKFCEHSTQHVSNNPRGLRIDHCPSAPHTPDGEYQFALPLLAYK